MQHILHGRTLENSRLNNVVDYQLSSSVLQSSLPGCKHVHMDILSFIVNYCIVRNFARKRLVLANCASCSVGNKVIREFSLLCIIMSKGCSDLYCLDEDKEYSCNTKTGSQVWQNIFLMQHTTIPIF